MVENAVYNRPITGDGQMRHAASVAEVKALAELLGIGVDELLGEQYRWLVDVMVHLLARSTNDDAVMDLCRFSRLLVLNLSDDRVRAIRDETGEGGWRL